MAAKKSKHQNELAKFEKAWRELGSPEGDGAEQAMRVLLARHGTRDGAANAMDAIRDHFVGINEFRIAKPEEIASVIAPHVKNDPDLVARHVRGFLRRYFKDHHTLDFSRIEELTPEGLRKYLENAIQFSQEVALAMFLQLLADELAREEDDGEEGEEEARKKQRTDREAAVALDRLRMACAWAAFGESPSKAKLQQAHRKVGHAFRYSAPPTEEDLEEPIEPTIAELAGSPEVLARKKIVKKVAKKKAAKKKKAATKKAARKKTAKKKKKAAKKKAAKKKAAKKKGGARAGRARPKTSRTTRGRGSTKKSSRR